MEEDFRVFSQETKDAIKKFNIPYKWRDSCVDELIDLNTCKEFYYYTSIVKCTGFQKIWEECQFKRERKIISNENFVIVPEEIRRKSNLT